MKEPFLIYIYLYSRQGETYSWIRRWADRNIESYSFPWQTIKVRFQTRCQPFRKGRCSNQVQKYKQTNQQINTTNQKTPNRQAPSRQAAALDQYGQNRRVKNHHYQTLVWLAMYWLGQRWRRVAGNSWVFSFLHLSLYSPPPKCSLHNAHIRFFARPLWIVTKLKAYILLKIGRPILHFKD